MQLSQDNTNLTSRLEALETNAKHSNSVIKNLLHNVEQSNSIIKNLLHNHIYDCEKALRQARFIEAFETYSRIIQSLNDILFAKIVSAADRSALRDYKLDYVTRLLDPPFPQDSYSLVTRTLSLLDEEEFSALTAVLPLFYSLRDGPYGQNTIQHPSPTVDQALAQIQSSSLSYQQKATLSTIIRRNQLSSKGVPLFCPSNSQTEAGDLEERLQQLKSQLDLFNS